MGLSKTNGKPNTSRAARLAELAREAGAKRLPWWVDRPRGPTPAQGWYWIAPSGRQPSFLGHNAIRAEISLEAFIDALT